MFRSAGCSFLRIEGFSSSLGVLYGGLGIKNCNFLCKIIGFFLSCKILQLLVIKILETDPTDINSGFESPLKPMQIHNTATFYNQGCCHCN
jgi:hypothetical protein